MPSPKDISAILADSRKVEAAMRRGVRKALIRHIQMGLPVVEWRDGKTVYVYPTELKKLVRSMGRGSSRRRRSRDKGRGRRAPHGRSGAPA